MISDAVSPDDLFACRRCGNCCQGYGGTYITEAEIDRICRFLGLQRQGFIKRYCQISGGKPVIAQGLNGYCVFWNKLCTIHPVKPSMCQKWPFIESILVDAKNWQTMAVSCPGMRSDFTDEQIQDCVSEVINRSS